MTGIEPFLDPFAGGLVEVIFDIARRVGGGFTQAIGDHRQVAQALKKYEDKYRKSYGALKVLGMREAVDLEAAYTQVFFLDELSIRQFIPIDDLERNYKDRASRRFRSTDSEKLDGFAVANNNPLLMVLGNPGGGKSTFLRRVGLEALKGKRGVYRHRCIPVMIELKRLELKNVDITAVISNELASFGFPDSDKFAVNALEQGNLLVLLDGLDEVVKEYRNDVINSIQSFVTKYGKNRYIASCRIAAYRSAWNQFCDIELADFSDQKIQQFIYRWFSTELDKETKTAEHCWQLLNDPSNTKSKELAHTPLLLTFLCLVYDRTQSFPINRAALYRKALDLLLEEWASEKRINFSEIYQGLNTDLEKVLLSEIAYKGFINNQFFFTEQELVDQIKVFLSDTVDKPKYLDGKAVLDAITTQQGIFVERAEGIYSFSHATLQEYLTAYYISRDVDLIRDCLAKYLKNESWREVFILIAGSVHNSEKFLDLIKTEIDNQSHTLPFKVKALLSWADQIIDKSSNNLSISIKRAIVLLIALDCADTYKRSQEFDLSNKLDGFVPIKNKALSAAGYCVWSSNPECEIKIGYTPPQLRFRDIETLSLSKLKIFRETNCNILIARLQAIQIKVSSFSNFDIKQFVDLAYINWAGALALKREWLDLSNDETEVLSNYLYTYGLLFECKKTSMRVSALFWHELEENILTIESNVITLDEKAYPLMMHLSIPPKYDIETSRDKYDPSTQTSSFNSAMSKSWCTVSGSTFQIFAENDSDSQEDD